MKIDFTELMKKNGYSYETLAKKVGCSVGVLNKFFNKYYSEGEVIKFEIVLNVVKLILPEKEKEFMYDFCLKSDKPNHLKCALEYANIHSNATLLKEIIEICTLQKNKEIKEFGVIYSVFYDKLIGVKESSEVYQEVNHVAVSSKELSVVKEIVEMNYYYDLKYFKIVNELKDKCFNLLDYLSDGFLKDSLRMRTNQMAAYIELHLNSNPETAREIAYDSINFGTTGSFCGFFYNIIATSYFGKSVKKMMSYASKSKQAYDAYYKGNRDVVPSLSKRFMKLEMIMNDELSLDFDKDKDDPLDLYIEGTINKNIYQLLQCLVELSKRGNLFFTEMVIAELKKLSCNQDLIDSIIAR